MIPQIDVFLDDGAAKEEWKMAVETKKILDPAIEVAATCVRVPVFVGHALAANVEFEHEISPDAAREALYDFEGVLVIDDPAAGEYVTPVEASASTGVRVARAQGPDRAARPSDVDRRRQSAQGRRAQRRPDRQALVEDGYL